MMDFWIKRGDSEQWNPIPPDGTVLVPDVYTIIARSPQPHFTITVELYQFGLAGSAPVPPGKRPISQTSPSDPGEERELWFQQKRSIRTNDEGVGVILPPTPLGAGLWELRCHDADLIAELFGEGQVDILRLKVIPAPVPPPLPEPNHPQEPHFVPLPVVEFSLMHTQLQGSPGQVLVLTGRIGCSGELEVNLLADEQVLFTSQRTIQVLSEVKTAVFSIPVALPPAPWLGELTGYLVLRPAPNGDPIGSIPFRVACLSPDTLAAEDKPSPLLPGLHTPHISKDPQSIPSHSRLVDTTESATLVSSDASSRNGSVQTHEMDPPPPSTEDPCSPERTLRKLLAICHGSLPDSPQVAVAPPLELAGAAANPLSPLDSPPPPAPQEELPPSPSPSDLSPPATPSASGELLPPELGVPLDLKAGDNIDIVLRLPASENLFPTSTPPVGIKFWVKHGQTRSLVDGPRWLLDFTHTDQKEWQALTRMTIPAAIPDLIFEAWAVSLDRQHQSPRTTLKRTIRAASHDGLS
ncbi:MAG: hypothetical protein NW237_02955 [Cyanobacteriota bacterium]|nr:hypothetical protein [Cyanobacteriota bacterium]